MVYWKVIAEKKWPALYKKTLVFGEQLLDCFIIE
ncbi:MAG: hypothetical protein RLZZ45_1002 [Bacteroidota bacterium]